MHSVHSVPDSSGTETFEEEASSELPQTVKGLFSLFASLTPVKTNQHHHTLSTSSVCHLVVRVTFVD